MTTLGSKYWGWSLVGQRIGRSIERCHVRVGGGVVTFATGCVGLDHRCMAWWSSCIAASLLLYAMVGASCKAHVSVVTTWTIRSVGATFGSVRL